MWKLKAEPQHDSYDHYIARWIAPDREVIIAIQDQTGELSSVRIRRSIFVKRALNAVAPCSFVPARRETSIRKSAPRWPQTRRPAVRSNRQADEYESALVTTRIFSTVSAEALVRREVQSLLAGYIDAAELGDGIDEFIVPPGLGDRAGVLGAIELARGAAG